MRCLHLLQRVIVVIALHVAIDVVFLRNFRPNVVSEVFSLRLMCYGRLHALLSDILCQYFVNLSLFAKTDQNNMIFLQRVLFVDDIRKLPPFVKSVEFQLATIVAVIFQEFLL